MEGCLYRICSRVRVSDIRNLMIKCSVQLLIVDTHTNNCLYFFFHQVIENRIIIPLVDTSKDEDGWTIHTLQRKPGAIYISCLAVIDEQHAFDLSNSLHPV